MTLALELHRRGRRVLLLDRASAATGASNAAAGMLAVHDAANPFALRPLAELSRQLYPALLHQLAALAPQHGVRFETEWTLEQTDQLHSTPLPAGLLSAGRRFTLLQEASLDPRRLFAALRSALTAAGIPLLQGTSARPTQPQPGGQLLVQTSGPTLTCAQFVDCTGAWSGLAVRPIKGQMLRVRLDDLAPHLLGHGNIVLRTPDLYIVPRLDGTAVVGSTLEDKGFCVKTKEETILDIRARAAALYPALQTAPEVERWAGLRPTTPDFLPLLGPLPGADGTGTFLASGHFRNGILLAPGTARVMAQLLCGQQTSVPLHPFNPARFTQPLLR